MDGSEERVAYKSGVSAESLTPGQKQDDVLVVAKGGGAAISGKVTVRVLAYVYSFVLIRGLGAEVFGLFTLGLTITMFAGVFASMGLNLGIVRFGAIHAQNESQNTIHRATMAAFRVSLPLSLLLTLAMWLSADFIAAGIFNKPELAPLIKALGLSIPFMNAQVLLLAATRAMKLMKYSVIVWIVQPLTSLLLAIVFLARGFGVQAVALAFVVSYILGTGLGLFFYLRTIPRKGHSAKEFSLRPMVKFSAPLSLTKWVDFANQRTEIFFLGMLPGAVDVGIYKIAWSMAGLETLFRESLEGIVAPFTSDLSHRQEIKQLEVLYKTTAKWSFTGALLLFLIYLLFAEEIMSVFDPAYAAGATVLILLGIAQLINASTGPSGIMLIMSGRSDLSLLNTLVMFSVSIALDWYLIPIYGLAGAALAGAAAITIVIVLRVLEVWLTLKIHPFKRSFAKPIVAGLLSAALVVALQEFVYSGSFVVDMVYALLLVVVFIAINLFLKLDAEDRMVLNAVHSRLRRLKMDHKASVEGRLAPFKSK